MKNLLLVSVLFTFLILIGCEKKSENTTDNKTDKTNEQIKADEKKVETGEKKGVNELGLNEGLPNNYPLDIPQPKNSKCMGSLATSDGTAVTFESSETAKDIFNSYKEQMKKIGFELGEGGESLVGDKGGLIGWKKESREIGLMVTYDAEQKKSQIVITYN
jgi:hypothetical protein